jgi:hypothetical protein
MENYINTFTDKSFFTSNLKPKITFVNELWVGKVVIPVNTELDFSGVHPLQHQRVLEIANRIYNIDKKK